MKRSVIFYSSYGLRQWINFRWVHIKTVLLLFSHLDLSDVDSDPDSDYGSDADSDFE